MAQISSNEIFLNPQHFSNQDAQEKLQKVYCFRSDAKKLSICQQNIRTTSMSGTVIFEITTPIYHGHGGFFYFPQKNACPFLPIFWGLLIFFFWSLKINTPKTYSYYFRKKEIGVTIGKNLLWCLPSTDV